jgi:hypothetical protein
MPTTLPMSYDAVFDQRTGLSEQQWMLIPLVGWAVVMLLVGVLFQTGSASTVADAVQLAGCF